MDIYEEVTRRIVEQLEQGEIPWRKPWIAGGSCVSYATGKPYSLLNQMLLGKPGEYLTFRQCQQAGGHIRRGEKAHMVVFWKWIEQENEETGEKKQIPFLRYYNVFHINQCEGIAARHAKGKLIGRRPTTKDDIPAIFFRHYPTYISGRMNISGLARVCGLSRPTVYKYLKMIG